MIIIEFGVNNAWMSLETSYKGFEKKKISFSNETLEVAADIKFEQNFRFIVCTRFICGGTPAMSQPQMTMTSMVIYV